MSREDKSTDGEHRLVLARASSEGAGTKCSMGWEFYFAVMSVFWNQMEMVVAQGCECTKCH